MTRSRHSSTLAPEVWVAARRALAECKEVTRRPSVFTTEPKPGDVFELPLGRGTHAYGHVLSSQLMGYYLIETAGQLTLPHVIRLSVAFRVHTRTNLLRFGRWPIVGNIAFPEAMRAPLRLWTGNAPHFRIYEWTPSDGGYERAATREEIRGLERDGIWDSTDVPARLKMQLRGETYPWLNVG